MSVTQPFRFRLRHKEWSENGSWTEEKLGRVNESHAPEPGALASRGASEMRRLARSLLFAAGVRYAAGRTALDKKPTNRAR